MRAHNKTFYKVTTSCKSGMGVPKNLGGNAMELTNKLKIYNLTSEDSDMDMGSNGLGIKKVLRPLHASNGMMSTQIVTTS